MLARLHGFLLVLAFCLFIHPPARACLWSYETDLNGHEVSINAPPPGGHAVIVDWQNIEANLREELATDPKNFEKRNDRAVALAHINRCAESLSLLLGLEKERPGLYVTASNLGTVYELLGEDREALRWINEGIHRNPDSHYGTEWVHVKILEAKLAIHEQPEWLSNHSILGLDFGGESRPAHPSTMKDAENEATALEYQLDERMQFVKPPDPIVADLLFDLGNLQALTRSAEQEEFRLRQSLAYGPSHPQLVRARLRFMQDAIEARKIERQKRSIQVQVAGSLVGVGLMVGLSWALWRWRRRWSAISSLR